MMGPMTDEEGARRRELLDGDAGALFREVLDEGVLRLDDPRLSDDHPLAGAVAVLQDLGLLRRDEAAGGWVAVDPTSVQPGVVSPLGREAVELLRESAAWAESFASLAQSYRRTPHSAGALTEIRGLPSINRFLETVVDDAESELLTAQPAGPRRARALEKAHDRDMRALQRGVTMRTLYQHTARRSNITREYVDHMRAHGAEIRTLDEFFNRLIVIDRRMAMVPGATSDSAVVVHDRHLVSYLADVFERSWERGRDYLITSSVGETQIAAEVRQMTVRMLTEGHSDSASAKRVGVSTRTYASYVAALKQEYGVQTRFQLGLAMGREQDPESAPEA